MAWFEQVHQDLRKDFSQILNTVDKIPDHKIN